MPGFFRRFYRTDYMIAYRVINPDADILNSSNTRFIPFKNNKKYWYADPLLYNQGNKIYMFYEAFNKKKELGEIGVATVINNKIVENKIILKEPFHMSYPFVFNINDKIYMIPETSSIKKLLLYESVRFPDKWRLKKVLMENVEFSDATILKHRDKLFLFVSKVLSPIPYRDELLLFTLEKDFRLIPHECNPIITDNEFTRPAGRVLKYDNKLVRVSQDCSKGDYGKAIKFNEIINISIEDYQEKNIATILPEDISIKSRKMFYGTHTYGRCGNFEVIDLKYQVFDIKKLFKYIYSLPSKVKQRLLIYPKI
jgi:hypothetical protein